jgi:hypothetical protein
MTLPNNNSSNCGAISEQEILVWTNFEFWCEGVLFAIVGGVGLLGNLISILVLATK